MAPVGQATEADRRADRLVEALTLDEKIVLVHTRFGTPLRGHPAPADALQSAGVGGGVPRLGIPPLQETDAGLGIADPANLAFDATAMPSALAIGATFDPAIAARAGAVVGAEGRALGFSVMLGGGADLIREPRGGRNFEYVSEDPLLTGMVAGAAVRGVQSRRVATTIKHFALNAQENGRVMLSANLSEKPARESDLLAFEIAIEQGHPAAVMTGYNRVDDVYASENKHLITDILKDDWGFGGWVMSDWGATHSTDRAALAGLDQESGEDNDDEVFFGAPLKASVEAGRVPMARLDDMVRRILRARIIAGELDDPPRRGALTDAAAHRAEAQRPAEQAIVLLKNDGGLLPIAPSVKHVLLVGGKADRGVVSGGGSSQVVPSGAIRAPGEPRWMFFGEPKVYDPSSPMQALREALPGTAIDFVDGTDPTAAAKAAAAADVAIVFAEQWSNESLDHSTLALPDDQDALIAAVAGANSKTIVVLETGGPVAMPWLARVPAVVEAWYPGARGGPAIAAVMTGRVDPSGRLPVTFPVDDGQLPRLTIPDHTKTTSNPAEPAKGGLFDVDYDIEGADVGYKWFLRTGRDPLFAFGHGLSYTRFAVSNLVAAPRDRTIDVAFNVTNVGDRPGIETPQIYLEGGGFTRRLVGFERVPLAPGETRHVALVVDPRLMASYDVAGHGWHIAGGRYAVSLRPDALADGPRVDVTLVPASWSAKHGPSLEVAGSR